MIVRNLVILVNLVENVQVWRPSEPERDLTRLESKHEIFFFFCVYKYWSQIHHGDNVNSQSRSGAGTLKILIHNELIFDGKIDLIEIYFAVQLKLVCFENMFCLVSISTPGQVVNWPRALVTSETGLWRLWLWHWSIPGIGQNKLTKHRRQFMFYKRLRYSFHFHQDWDYFHHINLHSFSSRLV